MTPCPACEQTQWKEIYKIGAWGIEQCSSCGFAQINPFPKRETRPEFYCEDTVVKNNNKKRIPLQLFARDLKRFFNRLFKRSKSGIFYQHLARELQPNARILDIGCGDGEFLKTAKQRFDCNGIEISEYLANLARKQYGLNVRVGDFLLADFSSQKYDGVTLISILEHLDDPKLAMQKCFDLLNKGGLLMLKTVNYSCINRMVRKEKWTGFRPPDHLVYFSPQNLTLLLKQIGFKKIKTTAWPLNDNMYCTAWK